MSKKLSIESINSNAAITHVGERSWYWSYSTCVAYSGPNEAGNRINVRRQSNYSPTTAKHMGFMGVKDWVKVNDEDFDRVASA